MQVISVPQAYQFLARLIKEYGPWEIPGSLLIRLQFNLVMGIGIAGQKIQQFLSEFSFTQLRGGQENVLQFTQGENAWSFLLVIGGVRHCDGELNRGCSCLHQLGLFRGVKRRDSSKVPTPAALPAIAPNHHRTSAVRASTCHHRLCLPSYCHCNEEQRF